jgi:hypothetical protein
MFELLKKIFSREGQATPKVGSKPPPAPSVPFDDEEDADAAPPANPSLPQELSAQGPLGEQEAAFMRATLRNLVWSGFDDRDAMREAAFDALDGEGEDAPAARLWVETQLDAEIAAKRLAEASWPATVEWDRLDAAFEALGDQGVVALHAAGYTMQEGRTDAWAEWNERGGAAAGLKGVVFYTLQDVETALEARELWIAYAAPSAPGDRPATADADDLALAARAATALRAAGFAVEEPQRADMRLKIAPIEWRKRSPE